MVTRHLIRKPSDPAVGAASGPGSDENAPGATVALALGADEQLLSASEKDAGHHASSSSGGVGELRHQLHSACEGGGDSGPDGNNEASNRNGDDVTRETAIDAVEEDQTAQMADAPGGDDAQRTEDRQQQQPEGLAAANSVGGSGQLTRANAGCTTNEGSTGDHASTCNERPATASVEDVNRKSGRHLEHLSEMYAKIEAHKRRQIEQRCGDNEMPSEMDTYNSDGRNRGGERRSGQGSNNMPQTTHNRKSPPELERWSESRINAISSLPHLQSMRHRLRTLLGHVEDKINSELVKRSLMEYEMGCKQSPHTPCGDRRDAETSHSADRGECCPLCISMDTAEDGHEMKGDKSICSVCEETNCCKYCRSACQVCNRTCCLDCTRACDGCSSEVCYDCVEKRKGMDLCRSCVNQLRSNGGGAKRNATKSMDGVVKKKRKATTSDNPQDVSAKASKNSRPTNRGQHAATRKDPKTNQSVGQDASGSSATVAATAPNPLQYSLPTTTRIAHIEHKLWGLECQPQRNRNNNDIHNTHPAVAAKPAVAPLQPNHNNNPMPIRVQNSTQQVIKTPLNMARHVFVIMRPGTIGVGGCYGFSLPNFPHSTPQSAALELGISYPVFIHQVLRNHIGWKYGLQQGDLLVPPFSMKDDKQTLAWFSENSKKRPFTIIVFRRFGGDAAMDNILRLLFPSEKILRGINYSIHRFVLEPLCRPYGFTVGKRKYGHFSLTTIQSVETGSVADVHFSLRVHDIICQIKSDGRHVHDTYDWMIERMNQRDRACAFEVVRIHKVRPGEASFFERMAQQQHNQQTHSDYADQNNSLREIRQMDDDGIVDLTEDDEQELSESDPGNVQNAHSVQQENAIQQPHDEQNAMNNSHPSSSENQQPSRSSTSPPDDIKCTNYLIQRQQNSFDAREHQSQSNLVSQQSQPQASRLQIAVSPDDVTQSIGEDKDGDHGGHGPSQQDHESSDEEHVGSPNAAHPAISIGARVSKKFYDEKRGKMRSFAGRVAGYDPNKQYYRIVYEDGDQEELFDEQVRGILIEKNTGKDRERRSKSKTHNTLPLLTGTLSYSIDERSHIIQGEWTHEGSSPQIFELVRELSPDSGVDVTVLPQSGVFNGKFVLEYPVGIHGQQVKMQEVIREHEVSLMFYEKSGKKKAFAVKGQGNNRFGAFVLKGTATKQDDSTSYDVRLRKQYLPNTGNKNNIGPKEKQNDANGERSLSAFFSKDDVPPPSELYQDGAICLKGRLSVFSSGGNAVQKISGLWAPSLETITDGSALCNKFEYQLACNDIEDNDWPQSGKFEGWFNMDGDSVTIEEHEIIISFRQNSKGDQNIEGYGFNEFGRFRISGVCEKDEVTMFRHYLTS